MDTLTKDNGMREILIYPSEILMLLQNVGENYFNNQIIDVIHNLWKEYHFIGLTKRIFVSSPKPYATAISHIQFAKHSNPRSFIVPGRTPEYESLLYCGFCNQYTIYHEHGCNDNPPWDPYNGYPTDALDTN